MFNGPLLLFQIAEATPDDAEKGYMSLLLNNNRDDDVALRIKEEAVYRLAKLYVSGSQFDKVLSLLQNANPFFAIIPKVKLLNYKTPKKHHTALYVCSF